MFLGAVDTVGLTAACGAILEGREGVLGVFGGVWGGGGGDMIARGISEGKRETALEAASLHENALNVKTNQTREGRQNSPKVAKDPYRMRHKLISIGKPTGWRWLPRALFRKNGRRLRGQNGGRGRAADAGHPRRQLLHPAMRYNNDILV